MKPMMSEYITESITFRGVHSARIKGVGLVMLLVWKKGDWKDNLRLDAVDCKRGRRRQRPNMDVSCRTLSREETFGNIIGEAFAQ